MDTNEAPPSIGLVGGKYQLVKLIGRGGMGSVWEARHVSLGTPSAIKFIDAEYANSAEARSRFDKEAKAAATIQSKHAIQIYDHGVTEDGKPYIVMELLTGEPLDKRIERLGRLTLQETARILQQVSRGLARAHERGIVHRDLKPENIFIVCNTDDDDEVSKVLDFGIAKIQNSPHNPGITSSTKTGAVLGTPFYMSPEQARGLRNVDHRTDVWSLGVIAFKCVSGHLPFDGESVGDLLVKICTAPVPIPSHSVPGLPQAFDTWFSRTLEREPERRFANVTELSEHLAFAAGISTGGRATSSAHGNVGGSAPTPAAIATASGALNTSQEPGSGGNAPNGSYGSPTPPPAGMTAAPFTSSQPVPGVVRPSTWKWVAGAAAIGLAVAGIGTTVVVVINKQHSTAAANSVGLAHTPSAPNKSGLPPDPAPPDNSPPVTANSSGALVASLTEPPPTPISSTPTPFAGASSKAGAKPLTGAKPAKLPQTGGAIVTAPPPPLPPAGLPPPQPLVTTPAPAPAPPRKPNKNDPGY